MVLWSSLGVLFAFLLGLLIAGSVYCSSHFSKGTIINEIDASGLTMEELESRMREYVLTVRERTGEGSYITETITGCISSRYSGRMWKFILRRQHTGCCWWRDSRQRRQLWWKHHPSFCMVGRWWKKWGYLKGDRAVWGSSSKHHHWSWVRRQRWLPW